MGSACCVAARDRTITNGPSCEVLQHRNVRYSPSWSFRWDNRGRVAGEVDTSASWPSDGPNRNGGSENKSETTYASDGGSPLENFQTLTWQKSLVSEGTAGNLMTPASDHSITRNLSMEVKESIGSPGISDPSPAKFSPALPSPSPSPSPSPTLPSLSSLSMSPLSSQSNILPAASTPSRWSRGSPGHHLLRQASDSRVPGLKSPNCSISEERPPFVLPVWNNESVRGSYGGSSDGWSMHAFSELMATSRRERWSFDSESLGFNRDKVTRSSSRISASPPIELQTCGVCAKLLTERSSWGSQKIIASNELSVVAVLVCGHVYHAECLENMTPEINKYDPICPVCTYGEKQTLKLSEKALKAEMELKAKNKRSRNRVVDSDLDSETVVFDHRKGSEHEGKGPKLGSSSSMKSSFGKPFLRRHFSFGSKGSKSLSENHQSIRKKGFFWAKSSRE